MQCNVVFALSFLVQHDKMWKEWKGVNTFAKNYTSVHDKEMEHFLKRRKI